MSLPEQTFNHTSSSRFSPSVSGFFLFFSLSVHRKQGSAVSPTPASPGTKAEKRCIPSCLRHKRCIKRVGWPMSPGWPQAHSSFNPPAAAETHHSPPQWPLWPGSFSAAAAAAPMDVSIQIIPLWTAVIWQCDWGWYWSMMTCGLSGENDFSPNDPDL